MKFAAFANGTWQDVRHAGRVWSKHPGLSAAVVASLILSTGAATAVFTFADVLLLQSLPVAKPRELYALGTSAAVNLDLNPQYFSVDDYRQLTAASPVVRDLIGSSVAVSSGVQLSGDRSAARVRAELVSGNYFRVLGVPAHRGRTIGEDDDRYDGAHAVAVLSDAAWRRWFDSRPDIIGRPIRLNGHPFTVIGVMDAPFYGTRVGFTPDLWVPLTMALQLAGDMAPSRSANHIELMLRLPPHVSLGATEQALTEVYQRSRTDARPVAPSGDNTAVRRDTLPTLRLVPAGRGLSRLRGEYGRSLVILLSAVGLLLLIACTNIANLLLARGIARRRELAIRLSQGATRLRIIRQLVTECLVLTLGGGALGWCAALAIGQGLLAFLPGSAPASQFAPGARAFVFTTAVVAIAGVIVGLVPSRIAARLELAQALRKDTLDGGRAVHLDTQSVLSALQIGLSLVLVFMSILFAQSLHNIRSVDTGFQRRHVLLAALDPMRSGYTEARARVFYDELLRRLRARPSVRAAGVAAYGSLSGVLAVGTRFLNTPMHADTQPAPAGTDAQVYINDISPGYFDAIGMPVQRGRDFGAEDDATAPKVAIVNETAARYFFGDADPIGRRIGSGREGPADIHVVGVVRDTKYLDLREPPRRIVYRPHPQAFRSFMTLHLSTTGDAAWLAPMVRQEVHDLDATLPVFNLQSIEGRMDESLRQERLVATVAGALSVLATLLALVGVYGIINYAVTRRTRELAIRMALGASPRHVLSSVMRRALLVASAGLVIGVPLALASTVMYRGLLFGMTGSSLWIAAGTAAVLVVLALSAAYVPARRAMRIEPLTALRQE